MSQHSRPARILDPGACLTLRPMRYPAFYDMYRTAVKNTWSVEEVDLSTDVNDLRSKMSPADRHMVQRLVAFFATGDSIVANNLVLNIYQHVNAPEARMYLSRQLYEEALHVQFYLTLLDTYVPDPREREAAFAAVETIPSIARKAHFCSLWTDSIRDVRSLTTLEARREFIVALVAFAAGVEGMFFFAAFAYVYYLRSRGLLNGLAAGTNWVFRDEVLHMSFAFEVIRVAREEEPELFDDSVRAQVSDMLSHAVDCEAAFADDLLGRGVPGMSPRDMRQYLEFVADQRLAALGMPRRHCARNPFSFLDLQDVQEVTNFFERRPSAYQTDVPGVVALGEDF